jgi:hypothetical protein
MNLLYIQLVCVLLACGCAADRQARTLAVRVDQDIAAYENAIDAKVNAENKFYRDQLETIRQYLGGNSAITIGTNTSPSNYANLTDEGRVQKTLPFGRIITHAEHGARIESEKLIAAQKDPPVMATIIAYVGDGLNEEQSDYLDFLERQRQLADSFNSSLAKIDEQKQKLASVRKRLASLAVKPSTASQFQALFAFGEAVRNELNKTNSPATAKH